MQDSDRAADIIVRKRRKGIYILPNLFTLAALFGGFYSIVMAMNGSFTLAAYGVLFAMLFDSLDGRVARMTNTQSAFGEQMDSLSDMVSFGVAPALIAYIWALKGLGRWGWIAAAHALRCGWRGSTSIPGWSISVGSRACPRQQRPLWWWVLSG